MSDGCDHRKKGMLGEPVKSSSSKETCGMADVCEGTIWSSGTIVTAPELWTHAAQFDGVMVGFLWPCHPMSPDQFLL